MPVGGGAVAGWSLRVWKQLDEVHVELQDRRDTATMPSVRRRTTRSRLTALSARRPRRRGDATPARQSTGRWLVSRRLPRPARSRPTPDRSRCTARRPGRRPPPPPTFAAVQRPRFSSTSCGTDKELIVTHPAVAATNTSTSSTARGSYTRSATRWRGPATASLGQRRSLIRSAVRRPCLHLSEDGGASDRRAAAFSARGCVDLGRRRPPRASSRTARTRTSAAFCQVRSAGFR